MVTTFGIFMVIAVFIAILFVLELIFFELGRARALKEKNYAWFTSLNQPFVYTRTKRIVFVCALIFSLSSGYPLFSINWLINLVMFVAIGVIADAVVLYLMRLYGRMRCKKEIAVNVDLQQALNDLKANPEEEDHGYQTSLAQFDVIAIAKKYVKPSDHLAFMTVDQGAFVRAFQDYPALTYDVEPYSDSDVVQDQLRDLPVKATRLTKDNKMPFKDKRIDVIIDEMANYEKYEITRVLKPGGYFVVHQAGSDNLKEFLRIYLPFASKRHWNHESCAASLQDLGYEIHETHEDAGFIRFRNLRQVYSYFKKVAPEVAANVDLYNTFFMNALTHIREDGYYQLTTSTFLVVAQLKKPS